MLFVFPLSTPLVNLSRYQSSRRYQALPFSIENKLLIQSFSWVSANGCSTSGVQIGCFVSNKGSPLDSVQTSVTKKSSSRYMENKSMTEEVVLDAKKQDGTTEMIVFATGGEIDVYEVQNLYLKVGWKRRPVITIARSLKNSSMVGSLHLVRQSTQTDDGYSRKLIGLATAISDQAVFATIWDVMVDPCYQGRGLGKALLEQMIRALRRRGIDNIYLFSPANAVGFCEKLGFQSTSREMPGMIWYMKP